MHFRLSIRMLVWQDSLWLPRSTKKGTRDMNLSILALPRLGKVSTAILQSIIFRRESTLYTQNAIGFGKNPISVACPSTPQGGHISKSSNYPRARDFSIKRSSIMPERTRISSCYGKLHWNGYAVTFFWLNADTAI